MDTVGDSDGLEDGLQVDDPFPFPEFLHDLERE